MFSAGHPDARLQNHPASERYRSHGSDPLEDAVGNSTAGMTRPDGTGGDHRMKNTRFPGFVSFVFFFIGTSLGELRSSNTMDRMHACIEG